MARFYETKEFREIEKHWNDVLKKDGFEDAEQIKHGERILKSSALHVYRTTTQDLVLIKIQYFERLNQKILENNFSTMIDRLVMQMAAQGHQIKTIIKLLAEIDYNLHRQTIRFIIRRYEHEWGLRFWTLKQRNLKYEPGTNGQLQNHKVQSKQTA